MTPTAELIEPASYTTGGVRYVKGQPVEVDFATARLLANSPRFKVLGLNTRAAIEDAANEVRPMGESLLTAIRDAANDLDVDDESNFDANGKASHYAIAKALGYDITVEERDRALGAHASASTGGKLETADGKTETVTGSRIKFNRPAAKAPPAEVIDPTTAGALKS